MSGVAMAEEENEYESDPEEAKLLLMRRRVASDDEAEEGSEIRETPRRIVDDSNEESEGVAEVYDDESEEEDGEAEYGYDEEYAEEIEEVAYEENGGWREEYAVNSVAVEQAEAARESAERMENNDASEFNHENEDFQREGERRMEPYGVPTARRFYMHDNRFQDDSGGQHRRILGGRRLWESKDYTKWGHDKFEEQTMQERSYQERWMAFRGRYRGRGMNRTVDDGYDRVNRTKEQATYSNQNYAPKAFRGRGPRRYQPFLENKELSLTQNKQSGKSFEKPSYVSSVKTSRSMTMSNPEPDMVWQRKQVFASSLIVASPPCYPFDSSTKHSNPPNKGNVKDVSLNRNGQTSVSGGKFTTEESSRVLQKKRIVDSIGLDKLHISDPRSALTYKPETTKQMQLSGPSAINSTQQLFRGQARGITSFTQMAYRPVVSNNQRNPGQTRAQSSVQAYGQQFTQHVPSGSQAASTSKATKAVDAVESELEAPESALEGKGRGQGNGRGSLYGGAQVLGTSGNTSPGDQNFPSSFQAMPFEGQHPGGMGVPAVGMAFPGYVGQPQLGLGNSEMAWLPMLAGDAGAVGASYRPPYISVDGSYQARPSGETGFTTDVSSKKSYATIVKNDWKPALKPELANDVLGQRQKKSRRYSEMKFDQ